MHKPIGNYWPAIKRIPLERYVVVKISRVSVWDWSTAAGAEGALGGWTLIKAHHRGSHREFAPRESNICISSAGFLSYNGLGPLCPAIYESVADPST